MPSTHATPTARIGLVGGGQLARMMATAAARLGCTCVTLDPTPGAPAAQVCSEQIVGDFRDGTQLRALADRVDVLTYDLEDIDAATLQALEDEGVRIAPAPSLLATIQDKLVQKRALERGRIATAAFEEVTRPTAEQFERFGYPLVQKARRGGYDGRGVVVMRDTGAFADQLPVPSLIERFVPARMEVGVMVARARDGATRAYAPTEMVFNDENVLDMLLAPARLPAAVGTRAIDLAVRTVEALDGVGIFGVELFWSEDDELLVNEVAPRTHNSGHHTIEACATDQFEQHLRAVLGLPLGSTRQLWPAALVNLLAEPGFTGAPRVVGLDEALAMDGVCIHLYGKTVAKPHRKMGHVTVIDPDLETARQRAERVRAILRVEGEERT